MLLLSLKSASFPINATYSSDMFPSESLSITCGRPDTPKEEFSWEGEILRLFFVAPGSLLPYPYLLFLIAFWLMTADVSASAVVVVVGAAS